MKKLIYLLIVTLAMLISCSKDMLTDENLDLKKARVPIPFKAEMCMTYNLNVPLKPVEFTPLKDPSGTVLVPQLYTAGQAWLSGHVTHLGEITGEQSILTGIHSELDVDAYYSNGSVVIIAEPEMVITGANGDQVFLKTYIRIDVTDPSDKTITGDWILTGGSGKFEDVTGSGTVSGSMPCWSSIGTMEYPD